MSERKNEPKLTANMLSGGFFVLVAAGFYTGSRSLGMGTNFQPGPGYMPTIVATLMFCLGIVLLVQDFLGNARSETWVMPKLRPFLSVAGIIGFALLIEPAGFAVAALFLITLACVAHGRIRWTEVLLLAAALISACILIFVVGLGQRIPLLP
ncbi:tripartite tricarboxylate transporter TctB family protein [Rhizobium puerariae]|uniref:Tripartite tricarboxylate transporter TctB family protein n=1 Tax=Rhizobium puerariae TaxID=1585791 RepID=A0ABV6AEK3_9HYPH